MKQEKPTGQEIAKMSKEVTLDPENSFETEREGKKVKFTPTKMPSIKSIDEVEDGLIIGVFENEIESDKLPKGKFNVFIAKVKKDWQGYLETDGKIVVETDKVSIKRHYFGDRKIKKPRFKFIEGSWRICFRICLVRVLWWCAVSTRICFYIG